MIVPEHLGLAILAGSLAIALALVGVGVFRLSRAGLALKARVEAYADLSVLKVVEITDARIAAAQRRAAGVPILRARAQAAVAEIDAARNRTRMIAQSVRFVIRKMLAEN